MSEQPGPVAFVSLRSTTATGPYNGEKTLNLNCPAKADHLMFPGRSSSLGWPY